MPPFQILIGPVVILDLDAVVRVEPLAVGKPSGSVPKYWFPSSETEPFVSHKISRPAPGALLNLPHDCQPLIIQGSIFSLSVGKTWMCMPLKNHGVLEET